MANSYQTLSLYAMVANNPIMLYDPDGKRIIVYGARYGFLGLKRHKYEYVPGSSPPSNASQFVHNAFEALEYVRKGDVNGIIDELVSTKKKIRIKKAKREHQNYFDDRFNYFVIRWDSYSSIMVYDNDGYNTGQQSPALGLFHEVAHSFRRLFKSDEH